MDTWFTMKIKVKGSTGKSEIQSLPHTIYQAIQSGLNVKCKLTDKKEKRAFRIYRGANEMTLLVKVLAMQAEHLEFNLQSSHKKARCGGMHLWSQHAWGVHYIHNENICNPRPVRLSVVLCLTPAGTSKNIFRYILGAKLLGHGTLRVFPNSPSCFCNVVVQVNIPFTVFSSQQLTSPWTLSVSQSFIISTQGNIKWYLIVI